MEGYFNILKSWFNDNYSDFGLCLSELYLDNRFDILHRNGGVFISELNISRIKDFSKNDSGVWGLIFDALLRQHGQRLDHNFTPIKQVKEFKL